MPTELRKIVFSRRELMEALGQQAQSMQQSTGVADARIVDVHVYQKFGGGVKVQVDLDDRKDGSRKRFNLGTSIVSDMLLLYCSSKGIPVAREAEKYLEVIGDNLALSQKIRGQEAFADREAGSGIDGSDED